MSIATINRCINLRNRHNNGPDRLMPRAIFVQQHGLAESKSDISDSILFSFACNSQPFTFLSCDRQEEMSQLFNISELKSILSPNLLGFSVFCLFFFLVGGGGGGGGFSQMLLTHYADGIAF